MMRVLLLNGSPHEKGCPGYNKYFTISQMPVVSSIYWNMVHGNTPEEVEQDLEGLETMRNSGKNTVWLMKCLEAGKAAGISVLPRERKTMINFIR